MSPASTHARSSQIPVIGAIVLLTLLAWAYLLHLNGQITTAMADAEAMRAMGMPMDQPWTMTDVGFAFVMWIVMMAGMMSPSAAPVLLVVARAASARGESSLTTILFGAGYFAVWTGFSTVATLAQWMLHNAALLSPSMAAVSPRAAGIALVVAGLYQMTPEKRACLQHCRNPIDFLMMSLAARGSRQLRSGRASRLVLSGLLLGPDDRALRRRRDEPRPGRRDQCGDPY